MLNIPRRIIQFKTNNSYFWWNRCKKSG